MLPIWTIYDRPSDYPHGYIARKFVVDDSGGVKATDETITGSLESITGSLESIRDALSRHGYANINRQAHDEPQIVESWM